jgi:AcrR family transcriptional regulator
MAQAHATRERILAAAEDVVIRDGVARLTIDAAAHEAGLSKGGVLYHFGTRDALVAAMVDRLITSFHDDLDAAAASDDGPGSLARRYVQASFAIGADHEREARLGAALLAAMAAQPALLAPLQKDFDDLQGNLVDDGIDPVEATIARLAADGIWLASLFGFGEVSAELRDAVAARLIERLQP